MPDEYMAMANNIFIRMIGFFKKGIYFEGRIVTICINKNSVYDAYCRVVPLMTVILVHGWKRSVNITVDVAS